MPIETLHISDEIDISLFHDIDCTLETSDLGDAWHGEHKHKKAGDAAYVIRPQRESKKKVNPPALWITGQRICLKAHVEDKSETGRLVGWTAGFVQSIQESTRNAHYDNGEMRKIRLNTAAGPLKDGQEDSIFYTDGKMVSKKSFNIRMDDAPNFEMPLAYGPTRAKLATTSGCDKFSSFPVLVKGRVIVALARVDWEVNWAGTVKWPSNGEHGGIEWQPNGTFLSYRYASQNAQVFGDVGASDCRTPFSLDLNEAENYCEMLEDGEWKPSTMNGGQRKNTVAARIWKGE